MQRVLPGRAKKAVSVPGVKAEYYIGNGTANYHSFAIVSNIDIATGAPVPPPGISQAWTTKFTADLTPLYTQTYTLSVVVEGDLLGLWINNQLICSGSGFVTPSGPIALTANQKVACRLEYFDDYVGGARCQLKWESSSQPNQIIPASQFTILQS